MRVAYTETNRWWVVGATLLIIGCGDVKTDSTSTSRASLHTSTMMYHGVEIDSSTLLVRFKNPNTAAKLHSLVGAKVSGHYSNKGLAGLQVVTLDEGKDIAEAIEEYTRDPNVLYAEPNYILHALEAPTPNDPRYGDLWGMNNPALDGGVFDVDINAPEAWGEVNATATPVTIFSIDTGVNYLHEDLAANIGTNPGEIPGNNVDDDNNGYVDDVYGINAITNTGNPMDDNGHGSHTAGTMAGVGNNGVGVVGLNWAAKVMGCKFLSQYGSGYTSDAIKCINYVAELKTRAANAVDIVASNNSWSGGGYSQAMYDAIKANRSAGVLFIAAAGNWSWDLDTYDSYPAGYDLDNVLSVAAMARDNTLAYFSNYGATKVDFAAPGVDILSTTLGNDYKSYNGTSMATPHATGLAALLKSQDPTRTWAQIKNLMLTTGRAVPALADKTVTGAMLRAWEDPSLGGGATNCTNRTLRKRLSPAANVKPQVGVPITLSMYNLVCADPGENPTVTVTPGDVAVVLNDDGLNGDSVAGDGVFTAQYAFDKVGTYSLAFPGDAPLSVTVQRPYQPAVTIPTQWHNIVGTKVGFVSSEAGTWLTLPFSLKFADKIYQRIFIGQNGAVSFDNDPYYYNTQLPDRSRESVIAPFWDDLEPLRGLPSSGVFVESVGEAPNRQFVIEYRAVPNYSYYSPLQNVTFQVVFAEAHQHLVFNYSDVDFGVDWPLASDKGGFATVGIQVNSQLATQFSYNASKLTNGLSLFWSQKKRPVLEGALTASTPEVNEGDTVTFSLPSFTDTADEPAGPWNVEWDFNYDGKVFHPSKPLPIDVPGALPSAVHEVTVSGAPTRVAVRVADKNGVPSDPKVVELIVHNQVPNAQTPTVLTEPREGLVEFSTIITDPSSTDGPWLVEWDFNYDGSTFRVGASSNAAALGQVTANHVYPEQGNFSVAVRVTDKDGSVSDLQAAVVAIADLKPKVLGASATPNTGTEPATCELFVLAESEASQFDPIRHYAWDLDNDGTPDAITQLPRYVSKFHDSGEHTVTVRVYDEDSYTATSVVVTIANASPVVATVASQVATEGALFQLQLRASDPAGAADPLTYSITSGPPGLVVTDGGLLLWVPSYSQGGYGPGQPYAVTVRVSDDDGGSVLVSFEIRVAWSDLDNDGIADTWEMRHGLDPTVNDATGDVDGDGIKNLDQFNDANGGPRIPGVATLPNPAIERITTQDFALSVLNAHDPDSPVLSYEFQLAPTAEFKGLYGTFLVQGGVDQTVLVVDDITRDDGSDDDDSSNANNLDLLDNARFYWRVHAIDEAGRVGPWSAVQKIIYSPLNNLPTAPVLSSPTEGAKVETTQPLLVVENASDVDDEHLTYVFRVFKGGSLAATAVVTSEEIASGTSSTSWQVPVALDESTQYSWSVTVKDSDGASVESTVGTFNVTQLFRPTAPTVLAPVNGALAANRKPTLVIANSSAPKGRTLTYEFEVRLASPEGEVVVTSETVAEGVEQTRYVVTRTLETGRTYYWQARAVDDTGALSEWAAPSMFVVQATSGCATTGQQLLWSALLPLVLIARLRRRQAKKA